MSSLTGQHELCTVTSTCNFLYFEHAVCLFTYLTVIYLSDSLTSILKFFDFVHYLVVRVCNGQKTISFTKITLLYYHTKIHAQMISTAGIRVVYFMYAYLKCRKSEKWTEWRKQMVKLLPKQF